MNEDRAGGGRLARKLGIVAAAVATGFLCGWSATGITGGVMSAVALGAGVAVPVFRSEQRACLPRLRWWR
jgi:hypothetical protein